MIENEIYECYPYQLNELIEVLTDEEGSNIVLYKIVPDKPRKYSTVSMHEYLYLEMYRQFFQASKNLEGLIRFKLYGKVMSERDVLSVENFEIDLDRDAFAKMRAKLKEVPDLAEPSERGTVIEVPLDIMIDMHNAFLISMRKLGDQGEGFYNKHIALMKFMNDAFHKFSTFKQERIQIEKGDREALVQVELKKDQVKMLYNHLTDYQYDPKMVHLNKISRILLRVLKRNK